MSFLNLQAADDSSLLYREDSTAYVTVPVDAIRIANARMIERDYLYLINAEKDSLITTQNNIIQRLDTLSNVYLRRAIVAENNIKDIKAKQKRKDKVIYSTAGIVIISLIIGIITK